MAIDIPEGFAQAAWVVTGQYGTDPFVTTLGLGIASSEGSLTDIANQCFAAFVTAFRTKLSNGLTLQKCTITTVEGGSLGSVDSDLAPSQGGRSSNDDVIALALLLNKRTAQLGRKGRGRMFIPGVLADDDTGLGGQYSDSARDDFQDRAADFLLNITGQAPGQVDPQELNPVLLHTDGTTPTSISSLVVAPKVGVLRKRLR